jgi:hypothetical protein
MPDGVEVTVSTPREIIFACCACFCDCSFFGHLVDSKHQNQNARTSRQCLDSNWLEEQAVAWLDLNVPVEVEEEGPLGKDEGDVVGVLKSTQSVGSSLSAKTTTIDNTAEARAGERVHGCGDGQV